VQEQAAEQAARQPAPGLAGAGEWHELVTAALIGTERKPPPPARAPGFSPDPAAMLLDRAAIMTVARRAGRMPGHAEPPPAAPDDPRPAVSGAAAARLARILGGEWPDLLAEWLAVAAARGRRPPDRLLPALLERAERARGGPRAGPHSGPGANAGLRRLAARAGGSRARWLAALNPAWAFVLEEAARGEPAGAGAVRGEPPGGTATINAGELVTRAAGELKAVLTAAESVDGPQLRARIAALQFRYEMLRELADDS